MGQFHFSPEATQKMLHGASANDLKRIIDPVKVVRLAFEDAVSVADALLLAEATVTEKPEEKPPAPAEADVRSVCLPS